jgi:uncharacterized repeat protein (TIGR01451 family)
LNKKLPFDLLSKQLSLAVISLLALGLTLVLLWLPGFLPISAAQASSEPGRPPVVPNPALTGAALETNQAITKTETVGSGSVQPVLPLNPLRARKIIAPAGVLDPVKDGVTLWHDYGSFALYQVSEAGLSRLLQAKGNLILQVDWMDNIEIDNYPINTRLATLDNIPLPLLQAEPTGPALHLIQFVGPIQEAWLKEIEAAGAKPIHYIANNAYMIWADTNSRPALNALAQEGRIVQFSLPYQPYFKVGPTLLRRVLEAGDPAEIIPVVIQVYNHAGVSETEEFIRQRTLASLAQPQPILNYKNIYVEIRSGDIVDIARRPDVVWLEEQLERELFDEVQGQIMAGNLDGGQDGPSGPGYLDWLNSFGFSTSPNDYPIIDITDDGIGGNSAPTVPNNPTNDSTLDPRVVFRISCNSSYANDGRGLDGHGHINTSIAVGLDTRTGSPFEDSDGFQLGMGINPYGRVGGTRIFGGFYNISLCGGTDSGVIAASYAQGARISSNSWGCSGCAGSYDTASQAYDVGTRDADLGAAGNQEFITIFAAGNDGPGASTIGSPGNGKNMITVGASENDRPTWTDGCGVGPAGANSARDIINFSSRGPAPGGRAKPELVAPGTHIQGTASTHPSYTGLGVCDQYHPPAQTVFASSSGTSHSTPAVAGMASLYYYRLQNTHGIASPSPALMKAFMMAHTAYLNGTGANDTLPSNNQGYGRPNMGVAFDNASRFMINQSVTFNNTGETFTFNGSVVDPTKPVRIVLAYTDQAGAVGVSPQVNNLNLAATVGASTYLGNRFSGQFSTTGGSPDTANNYEAIFLPAGTTGSISVTVTAFNIAGDGVPNSGDGTDQDFALVCYNCAQFPDFLLEASPASLQICAPANAVYNLTVGSILGYNDPVTLSASGQPAGTTATFSPNPVTPSGSSVLTIGNTGAAAPGSYNIEIAGVAPTSTHTTTVQLDLYNSAPGALSLLSPANGATNLDLQPNLSWTAATQAISYVVEIATDATFSNVVYSATVAGTSHVVATPLSSNTTYYWRVRPDNICGPGSYSATFSFITKPLPGDCTLGSNPNILLSEGFEAGPAGWAQGAGGSGNTWALWSTRVHSGTQAWHADAPGTVSDQRLVSPPISLPTGQSPLTLQFWNYQHIEHRFAGGCYDGGILEISTDSGGNWTWIPNSSLLTDPYDGPINAGSNPLNGQTAWCGDPQDWLESVVDLDAYAGQTVNFRFRLGTDNSVGREGWTIDDVVVQSCSAAANLTLTKTVTPAAPAPGSAITYTLSYSNTSSTLASGVVISDIIPAEVLNPSYSSSGAAITPTGTTSFTWQVEDLSPGEGGIITISGVVDGSLGNGVVITNTATITSATPETDIADNTSTVSVTVTVTGGGTELVYLPIILKDAIIAPDLIVESLTATTNSVTVVIRNIGTAASVDAFWVDVYLDPNPAPTAVNQTWPQLSDQGLVWGVTQSIPVSGTLTLTVGDAYYSTQYSSFSGVVPPGTPVWAQVDSVNLNSTYGGVLESHEISGGSYNNITGPVTASSTGEPTEIPVNSSLPPAANDQLPPRN